MDAIAPHIVYAPFVVLAVLGTYLMLSHRNFVKAIVGLQLFQTAIILFFILLAVRTDATIPIQPEAHAEAGHTEAAHGGHHYDGHAAMYNPLTHALMLTAIVVGVATQGVALAILRRIRRETGTVEDFSTETELA